MNREVIETLVTLNIGEKFVTLIVTPHGAGPIEEFEYLFAPCKEVTRSIRVWMSAIPKGATRPAENRRPLD